MFNNINVYTPVYCYMVLYSTARYYSSSPVIVYIYTLQLNTITLVFSTIRTVASIYIHSHLLLYITGNYNSLYFY